MTEAPEALPVVPVNTQDTDDDDVAPFTLPADVLSDIRASENRAVRDAQMVKRKHRPWVRICRCGHPEGYHSVQTGASPDVTSETTAGYTKYVGAGCYGALGRYTKYGMTAPHCGCATFEPWIEVKGGGRVFRQNPKGHMLPPLMRGLARAAETNDEREKSGSATPLIQIRWLITQRCHRCSHVGADVLPYYADDSEHSVQMGCATCRSAAPVHVHPK